MESYKVRICPVAKQDLLDIIDYLNTLSPDAALRYYDLLTEEIAGLSQMPDRCLKPRDLALAAKGCRCLAVKNYLVFYVAAGDTVQIRRILYVRRDYSSLFYSVVPSYEARYPPNILPSASFLCRIALSLSGPEYS